MLHLAVQQCKVMSYVALVKEVLHIMRSLFDSDGMNSIITGVSSLVGKA